MIGIYSNWLTKYIGALLLICREESQKSSIICTIILLWKLQIYNKLCYRVTQLHKGITYRLLGSISIQTKELRKVIQGQNRAEHKYFSISKDCYCSTSQIHDCCYYNNLEIGKATHAKDLINILEYLAKYSNCCNSLMLLGVDQSFIDCIFS